MVEARATSEAAAGCLMPSVVRRCACAGRAQRDHANGWRQASEFIAQKSPGAFKLLLSARALASTTSGGGDGGLARQAAAATRTWRNIGHSMLGGAKWPRAPPNAASQFLSQSARTHPRVISSARARPKQDNK